MRPVFDVAAGRACSWRAESEGIESRFVIVTEAGKDGLVVAALEHVDRVELQQPDAVKQQIELSRTSGLSCRRGGPPEPLSCQQHAARLGCRKGVDHGTDST